MQRIILALAGGVVVLGTLTAWTQESGSKPTTSKPAAAEEEKASGRLPNNYGKLGLSDKQKKSIYETQGKYATEISVLVRKVEELRNKRDAEVEAVLTAEQKTKLKELLAESAKKSATKKGAKSNPEAEPSKK